VVDWGADEDGYSGGREGGASVRLVLLHPHEIARHGLRVMLASIQNVDVVCGTGVAEVALATILTNPPDVLVIPTSLGETQIGPLVAAGRESLRVLALVVGGSPEDLSNAARMSADGYVMESTLTIKGLAAAIHDVVARRVVLPAELSDYLLARARGGGDGRVVRTGLTSRERQALTLVADGLSNKEVARRLGISENGAKRHVASILSKLNTPSRAGAVAIALTEGILRPDQSSDVPSA